MAQNSLRLVEDKQVDKLKELDAALTEIVGLSLRVSLTAVAIAAAIGASKEVIDKKMTATEANKLIDASIGEVEAKLH